MRQKKSNLNEIGDTKRGQYMLGRTAARAADREDMNTLDNSLKRYNNGGLNSPFTKGVSDQTDVDVLGYDNSTIKARYNAYKMHDMKKQGKLKKKTYPIYIQKLAEMGISVEYAIEKLMEVCPHLEYGYELDKERIRHLLNKDERFNKTYGKIMYDAVMKDTNKQYESKNPKKKAIKESQLRNMIAESVKEAWDKNGRWYDVSPEEQEKQKNQQMNKMWAVDSIMRNQQQPLSYNYNEKGWKPVKYSPYIDADGNQQLKVKNSVLRDKRNNRRIKSAKEHTTDKAWQKYNGYNAGSDTLYRGDKDYLEKHTDMEYKGYTPEDEDNFRRFWSEPIRSNTAESRKLTESQLRAMIKESLEKILNEHDETMRDTVNRIITPLIRKYPEAYERAKREMVQRGSSFGSWWDFTNIEDEKEARELWMDTAYQLLDDGVISYERYVYLALRGGSR